MSEQRRPALNGCYSEPGPLRDGYEGLPRGRAEIRAKSAEVERALYLAQLQKQIDQGAIR